MSGGTFVYVSNAGTREIRVLQLDTATGDLTPVQQLVLDVPGPVMPLAVSPDRRFLYAAQRGEPCSVTAMAIDGTTGCLSVLGSAPLLASTPYIICDRTGRWLVAAYYPEAMVSVSPIGQHGFPQPPHQVLRTELNPHSVQIDASNRHAYVPCLGSDVVLQFNFDAVTGRLSANTPAFVRVSEGAGPRHFAFHPNNRVYYQLNELDGSLYVFDYDAASGLLSEKQTTSVLPPGFDGPRFGEHGPSTNGGPKAADIHVTPDGCFLYASERTSHTLAAFRIDQETGRLESVESFATEETPRGFNIDPTGRYLIAVGQSSHHLTTYEIDQSTGRLTTLNRYEMGQEPNWVEVHRLP